MGLGIAACASGEPTFVPATQVIVYAHSDFEDELVRVDMELYDEQESKLGGHREVELGGQQELPLSFTIVPPTGSVRRSFLVLLRGHDASGGKVETKTKVTFVEKTTLQLDLWLRRACQQTPCRAGQTCSVGAGDLPMCTPTPTAIKQEVDGGVISEAESASAGAVDSGNGGATPNGPATTPEAGVSTIGGGRSTSDAGVSVASDAGSGARDSGAADSGSATQGVPDAGPSFGKDGDPSAPLLALSEVPCRSSEQVNATSNFTYNGRAIILDYPCGKREGAQFTLLVNLHGTTTEALRYYMRDFFAAHRSLSAQNLIIVTPPSVVQQWGNGDNGSDLPYLIDVVNWVYTKFTRARIRSLWFIAHSWGASYAARLGCDAAFAGRLRGLVMVGASTRPACTSFSVIAAHGTADTGASLDQSALAAAHGCAAQISGPEAVGNNERRYYTGCSGGYVHEDYQLLGKAHADTVDPAVVAKVIESIKGSEP